MRFTEARPVLTDRAGDVAICVDSVHPILLELLGRLSGNCLDIGQIFKVEQLVLLDLIKRLDQGVGLRSCGSRDRFCKDCTWAR